MRYNLGQHESSTNYEVSTFHDLFLGVSLTAARAATPARALIIDGQNNHDWKHTTPVLKKILEDTWMFQVDVLTSPPKGGDFNSFQTGTTAQSTSSWWAITTNSLPATSGPRM